MDKNILEEVLEDNNFLIPYLNQFRKNFKGNPTIKEIGISTDKYIKYLASIECDINTHELYDGIIAINTYLYEDKLEELKSEINNSLKEKGFLFIVIRNKSNLKEKMEYHLMEEYKLVQEYIGDDNWKFLLYQKSTIK